MADVYFKCTCGKSLAVDANGVGQTVLCVDCGQPIEVPNFDIEFACEACQTTHMAPITVGGDRIKCTICGHCMTVPRPGIDIKPVWADPLGCSGFQVRRRPKPEAFKPAWYPLKSRTLLTATLGLAFVAGVYLVPQFITKRQVGTDRQERAQVQPYTNKPAKNAVPSIADSGLEIKKLTERTTLLEKEQKKTIVIASEPARNNSVTNVTTSQMMSANSRATPAFVDPGIVKKVIADPAKPLLDEYNAVKAILLQNPTDKKNAVLIGKIKKCREHVLEYTRTHTGIDLDGPCWMNAVVGTLWLSSYREWNSFEEADRAIREAMDILAEAEPEKPGLNIQAMFDAILLHEQVWYRQAPERCAEWLDEACELAYDGGNTSLEERWGFIAPNREINLIFAASIIPPERRKAFQDKRERTLLSYLKDEVIPFEWRTKDLWWWAVNLKTMGEMQKAARLLDAWQKQYDRRIEAPLFFEIRMLIAVHGDGDWEKAREMVGRMRELVRKEIVPEDNWSWNNMTGKYYKYILTPPYEIKRQYRIEMDKEARKDLKQEARL